MYKGISSCNRESANRYVALMFCHVMHFSLIGKLLLQLGSQGNILVEMMYRFVYQFRVCVPDPVPTEQMLMFCCRFLLFIKLIFRNRMSWESCQVSVGIIRMSRKDVQYNNFIYLPVSEYNFQIFFLR